MSNPISVVFFFGVDVHLFSFSAPKPKSLPVSTSNGVYALGSESFEIPASEQYVSTQFFINGTMHHLRPATSIFLSEGDVVVGSSPCHRSFRAFSTLGKFSFPLHGPYRICSHPKYRLLASGGSNVIPGVIFVLFRISSHPLARFSRGPDSLKSSTYITNSNRRCECQ